MRRGWDRASSHLSKTRNTYARKIDDVLVGVLMTREMDVRTETLYILRGGKNIMYYTLLRRASLTLSLLHYPPPPPPPLVTSCSLQKGDVILVCKGLKRCLYARCGGIKLSGNLFRQYLYPSKSGSYLCKLLSTIPKLQNTITSISHVS